VPLRPRGHGANGVPTVPDDEQEPRVRKDRSDEWNAEDELRVLVEHPRRPDGRQVRPEHPVRPAHDRLVGIARAEPVGGRPAIVVPDDVLVGVDGVPERLRLVQKPHVAVQRQDLPENRRPAPPGAHDEEGPPHRFQLRDLLGHGELPEHEGIDPPPPRGDRPPLEQRVADEPRERLRRAGPDVIGVELCDHKREQ